MTTALTDAEFAEALRTFTRSAFRLELQPAYAEPSEVDTINRFIAGDPQDPTEVPGLAAWYEQVRHLTSHGRVIERVRIQEDPPTGCQRWERWTGTWNAAAGEKILYLTRGHAHQIGLLPAAGDTDWWLIDDTALILMRFDDEGHRTHTELTTDPALIEQARTWRDLAIRHGVLNDTENTVTA